MTEKEAIDELLFLKAKLYNGIYGNRLGCVDVAIKALEEMQMYKDGKLCLVPSIVFSKQCEKLDLYKGIGTLEECRAAREKQKPKSVKVFCSVTGERLKCPECGGDLKGMDVFVGHCKWCGQSIEIV